MENKRFLTAQDVMEMLEVSLSYAYKLIRRLNAELESEGFVTIKGCVSTQYFIERIYGLSIDKEVGQMAVIKNKKTGMWEVRTYYKDLTGERKQKTKRDFAKKSEALEWERNFKLKENQSISMSFQSFVDIYLTDLEPRIKRNSFLTKKHIIETKILPYFGKRKLTDKQKEIEVAQKEADKWMMITDTAKWQTEQAQIKLEEAEELKKELLRTVDGDDYLKEQVIELRYQNQMLQEENRSLKDKLEKAYEFMKQFVLGGINLLEKFLEWIGEKVKDVKKEKRQRVLYMLPQNCNELFNTFTISENTGAKICGMIQPRR